MHTEEKMGWFFGCFVFFCAFLFAVVAVLDGETHWRLGWIFAFGGWWLVGVSLIATGKSRAKTDGLEERLAKLIEDRSAA